MEHVVKLVLYLVVRKLQITTLPDDFPDAHSTMNDLRLEYVVAVEGVVRPRPSESVNKKMKTGTVEVSSDVALYFYASVEAFCMSHRSQKKLLREFGDHMCIMVSL